MSKIEGLKKTLSECDSMIKGNDDLKIYMLKAKEKLSKEIAALEAETAAPRQWSMYLDDRGDLTNVASIYVWAGVGLKEHKPITVIEKKPVRVTKAMANQVSDYICSRIIGSSVDYTMRLLRIAGIDAVAADEP